MSNNIDTEENEFKKDLNSFKKHLKNPNNNPYKILTGEANLNKYVNTSNYKSVKLNLASGTDIRDGWFNLDAIKQWPNTPRGCEIIWDARKELIPFFDNTVDEIRTGELFLHIPMIYHKFVLKDIYRVMKPGATFEVNDINMVWVMQEWLKNPSDKWLAKVIWGESYDDFAEWDRHCNGFTPESLAKLLTDNGFVNLNRVNIHNPKEILYELTYTCQKPLLKLSM